MLSANAQRPDYDDLLQYLADKEYEKVISKAQKYTQGSDSRKDALPYFFLSRANYEISKGEDQELTKKFPRAYKDAIKYASKALQKDDSNKTIYNANIRFFSSLKSSVFEDIQNLVATEEFGRLAGTLPLMDKLEKNEVGTAFLKAVAKHHRGDAGGFRTDQTKANDLLSAMDLSKLMIKENEDPYVSEKKDVDRAVFKYGILQYAKLLVQIGEISEAKSVLGKVKQLFEEDENFMEEYNKIVN
jgi:hypothetical protein